jgi:hypothetical protein
MTTEKHMSTAALDCPAQRFLRLDRAVPVCENTNVRGVGSTSARSDHTVPLDEKGSRMAVAQPTVGADAPQASVRDIPGFPGYRIHDNGLIESCRAPGRSHVRLRDTWVALKPYASKDGYMQVALCRNGKAIKRYVHLLVLETFRGACPSPSHQGCHGDGCKANNMLSNLRWDTPSGNNADKLLHGTAMIGSANHMTKLSDDDVREMRRRRLSGETGRSLAKHFGVDPATVSEICNGKKRQYVN